MNIKRFLAAATFFLLLLVAWEMIFRARIWSPVLVPSPRQVGAYLVSSPQDGTLWSATVITMRRLLVGYAIGIVGDAQT